MDPRLHLTSSILAERIVRLIEPHCDSLGTCSIQQIRGSDHKLESHKIKSITRIWKYIYLHDSRRDGGGLVILHNERLNGSPLSLSADVDVTTCPKSTSLLYSVLPDRCRSEYTLKRSVYNWNDHMSVT